MSELEKYIKLIIKLATRVEIDANPFTRSKIYRRGTYMSVSAHKWRETHYQMMACSVQVSDHYAHMSEERKILHGNGGC